MVRRYVRRLTLRIIQINQKVQTSQIKTTDVHNGPSINQRTVVHFCRLTLRIFLEIRENRFFEGNERRAEEDSVDQSKDRSSLPSFPT